jgi:excisionase family DNA binding protein
MFPNFYTGSTASGRLANTQSPAGGNLMTQELMQVRAAARHLGVHENTVRRWEEAGLIRAIRLPSGVRRFRRDDIERIRTSMYEDAGFEPAARAAEADATHEAESSAPGGRGPLTH